MASQQKGSSIDPKNQDFPQPETQIPTPSPNHASFPHPLPSFPPPPFPSPAFHSRPPRRRHRPPYSLPRSEPSLQSQLGLSHSQCALVLSPNSLHLPILHLSLLSLGVIVSPSNPASSSPEISRQIRICKPAVAFATSATAQKIPNSLRLGTILLDSAEFESMMMTCPSSTESLRVEVKQSDTATILYSSGTTGRVKGVELTHRNWISMMAGIHAVRNRSAPHAVCLCTVPFFHVYGFAYCLRVLVTGDTLAWMGRFDLKVMMRSIERFRIAHMACAPPAVVALVKHGDINEMDGYDLSSLQVIGCGGAPLSKSVVEKLRKRLPNVQVSQGYGMTETTARVFGALGPEETRVEGANGRLMSDIEAKIVETETGSALPPLMHGEIWVRGPYVMKGNVDIHMVAPYKKIRRVAFINAIPKNVQGKVLRKELIKLALSKL
ncbi:hypothetical protein DVH24_033783 [Malus domestica]|uniref:AMP-dependent synthetase/ligase domain-containing protein n=1 Tax=Malus domestica TaxID=3750 RepID=A0A498HRI9_MALDO|nr:hypothetical protein DVH24_033783 [Malus domestica]